MVDDSLSYSKIFYQCLLPVMIYGWQTLKKDMLLIKSDNQRDIQSDVKNGLTDLYWWTTATNIIIINIYINIIEMYLILWFILYMFLILQ